MSGRGGKKRVRDDKRKVDRKSLDKKKIIKGKEKEWEGPIDMKGERECKSGHEGRDRGKRD